MVSTTSLLFEDTFRVTDVDKGGQVFHNVNRALISSDTAQTEIVIDVQGELYRLKTKEKISLAIAKTLNLQGKDDKGEWDPNQNEPSLLDKYDYCMYGKVFKVDQIANNKVVLYVSHGGLLMKITGPKDAFLAIEQDAMIYTLLKRVQAQ